MTGYTSGRLTAIRPAGMTKQGETWMCQCACGRTVVVTGASMRRSKWPRMGCGFCRYARGVNTHAPTYNSWRAMIDRCSQPTHGSWADYGGRGIAVCFRWKSFRWFLEDMGPRPDGTSLDRINNEGNYEPGNCRWATPVEQRANRRRDPQSDKQSCPRGHAYDVANTHIYKGKRSCRACRRERYHEYKKRRAHTKAGLQLNV